MITKIVDGVEVELTQEEVDQLNWERSKENPALREKSAVLARTDRDNLLRQTDWMALSDVAMSPEMTAYRQALRDITNQEGFPFDITWPTKP